MTMSYCPYCQTNREKRNYIDPFTQIIYSKCSTCSRIIQREIQRQNKISYMNESNQQQETIQEKKTQTKIFSLDHDALPAVLHDSTAGIC